VKTKNLGITVAAVSLCASGCFAQSGGPVDPRSNAIYDVARDSFSKGQLREALAKVDEALEMDGSNADAAYLGSVVLLDFCAKDPTSSDCRFDEAEKYARRAVHANDNMRDAKNALGVILINEKRYDDAIAVLKPLANDILYGSPEKSWGNLGWAYLEKGQPNEAVDALRRAVAAQPNFCVGNFRLGVAYEKMGDLGAAEAALTRALQTNRPGCDRLQDAFDARARISLKAGKKEEARVDLQKCRDIASTSPIGMRCDAQIRSLE
jgi:type IV pilus assembly protein PilF